MRITGDNKAILPIAPTKIAGADVKGDEFAGKLKQAMNSEQESENDKKLRSVCKEMESVFINYMLTQMRATVPKSSLLGHSSQQDILYSMLDEEQSKNMANAGGIGIADMLYRQLSFGSHNIRPPK